MLRSLVQGLAPGLSEARHLPSGKSRWQLGTDIYTWWPVGAHLNEMFGPPYAVIASAVGVSDANGIGQLEAGTLEVHLTAVPGPTRFIQLTKARGFQLRKSQLFRLARAA